MAHRAGSRREQLAWIAHLLRTAHDAVLVGSGAARTDDPHLAVRHVKSGHRPLRIVLDARGTIVNSASRVADESAPTLVVLGPDAPELQIPVFVERLRIRVDAAARFDLSELLGALGRRGVRTLLLEGGPTLAGAFLAAGYIDEVVGYIRAAVLGAGRPLVDLADVLSIGDLRRFRLQAVERVGEDVRINARSTRRRSLPHKQGL